MFSRSGSTTKNVLHKKKRNRLGGEWKGGIKSAERIRSGILWPSVRSVTLGWAANGKHESVYANRCNENSQLCKAAHFPLFSWFLMARKQSGRLDLWPPSRRNACSRCPVSCCVESLAEKKIWWHHLKQTQEKAWKIQETAKSCFEDTTCASNCQRSKNRKHHKENSSCLRSDWNFMKAIAGGALLRHLKGASGQISLDKFQSGKIS